MSIPEKSGLYNPLNEHDACGIGAIVNIKGKKSHDVVKNCLQILVNLEHRGGTGAEDNTGDGAGILTQIPHQFFKSQNLGFSLPKEGEYGVAQIFVSINTKIKELAKQLFCDVVKAEGFEFLGFREVPVNSGDIGKTALTAMPYILQAFVKKPEDIQKGKDFDRVLYRLRRLIEKKALEMNISKFYFCSFSSTTIIYKGMLLSTQVRDFYIDLKDITFESAIAMVHSRFSTNTFPSWERAHPNRFMIHNGEINTILGNVDSISSREGLFTSSIFEEKIKDLLPVIEKPSSDSAMFDNTLEFMYMNGRSLAEVLMMMIPEPWDKDKYIDQDKKDFYEFNSTMMEPWDGPTGIVATDGVSLVAGLDRNGLRPSRYCITSDDFLILSSETGALEVDEAKIIKKSRLEPGKILVVDTNKGLVISDKEMKSEISKQKPYADWNKHIINIEEQIEDDIEINESKLLLNQTSFGYVYDNIELGILPMANKGEETLVAMGTDIPLAVLSKRNQNLFSYFKQLFAQVTNPPIDAIREEIVTSTIMYLGKEGNILEPTIENAHRIRIQRPIISNKELSVIRNTKGFRTVNVDIVYDYRNTSLEEAIKNLNEKVETEIDNGASIIILSDKNIDKYMVAIPSLLATSSVHQYLVSKIKRTCCSLILETGEAREIHHYACLLGFGATAINPYLVFESIKDCVNKSLIDLEYKKAVYNYIKATVKGIVKISSKMGISTLQAYNGAQIFECIGIDDEVCNKYFGGIHSSIGGVSIKEIETQTIAKHKNAYDKILVSLDSEGSHSLRNGKEEHLYNPFTIFKLQNACRTGNYQEFKEYSGEVDKTVANIRNLMKFKGGSEISIDEVESVDNIVKRFKTGAMSFGSISREAHECLAIAMNRLGGKSNTGEGGELRERFFNNTPEVNRCSQIKQVASGRFGVTMEYLTNANEIQIKMAQGAKPGEGGQLPGTKVYPIIAFARHSTPGVSLISPPPHHDIYSIEDLAQLIYDLKNANRDARISVKLVSEKGIGCVASGVAKAGANVILVSGFDGGTGASPRTSIQNAGMPWEIGLADTHQTLIMNDLRERVIIETDGKLMTGRDLAIAILLGAEEFGFATAPLIALGCVMMRVCNLDTCPVGIATQSEQLRKNFKGKPEYVINFMRFIAEELREYMALLGFRTIDEMVGHYEVLDIAQTNNVNLQKIFNNQDVRNKTAVHFTKAKPQNFENTIDMMVLLPLCKEAIASKKVTNISLEISNINRSFGTILSNEITKVYGEEGLPINTINVEANGHAGNSFGAFLTNGVNLSITGDANDYLGKGLCGGTISVKMDPKSKLEAKDNIIAGNVILYGATKGEVYIDGVAGERFCVRNSGATACCLGVGQHGLEYMTGGTVLVLGKIGRNFAAGMSGGVGYVYGNENKDKVNLGLVDIFPIDEDDANIIKDIAENHIKNTNSKYARELMKHFDNKDYFKVVPRDFNKMQTKQRFYLDQGLDVEEAKLKAFLDITKEAK